MPIEDSINSLVAKAESLLLIPEIQFSHTDELPIKEIYKLYDARIDDEHKKRIEKSVKDIWEKLGKLNQYREDHQDDERRITQFEHHITVSITKLVDWIRSFVQESLSTNLTLARPDWIEQMKFDGAKSVINNPDYEYLNPGKTTGGLIIMKKRERADQRTTTDIGFTIAIVNCAVKDIKNKSVSKETLVTASPSDAEVFDGIHEFDRLYAENPPGLGVIQIDQNTLEIRHC